MRLSKRVARLENQVQSDGDTYVYGYGFVEKGLITRVKELEEEVERLKVKVSRHKHVDTAPLEAYGLAKAGDSYGRSALKRLDDLEKKFLDHHDVVLVNDASMGAGAQQALARYYIYRGKTPQGRAIHAVRRPAELATEYHVEGKAVPDERNRT